MKPLEKKTKAELLYVIEEKNSQIEYLEETNLTLAKRLKTVEAEKATITRELRQVQLDRSHYYEHFTDLMKVLKNITKEPVQ